MKCVRHYVQGLLKDLSETEFNRHKESLSIQQASKPKSMKKQAKIYKSEIINQYYNFNRAKIEVEELKSITKKDIVDFYNVRRNNLNSQCLFYVQLCLTKYVNFITGKNQSYWTKKTHVGCTHQIINERRN